MEIITVFENYFLLFIIYSICGWIIEEIYCSILEKKIVNRGFLIGPLCPIYGFGGVGISVVLMGLSKYPVLVFITAILLCGILEYSTSYVLEKIFHARWWDYSKRKFNLNGRICARTLIPFGLFGLAAIYILTPFIFDCIKNTPKNIINIITIILLILFIVDVFISMKVVSKVTHKIKKIKPEITKDDTNEISNQISEIVTSELEKTKLGKRLLDAFPDLRTVKEKIKEAAEKGKVVAQRAVNKGKSAVKSTTEKGKKAVKKSVNNIKNKNKK